METVRIETLGPGHYQLIGDLTFDTVAALCKQKKVFFRQQGDVLVDLSLVTKADSAGLACLLELIRQAKSHGVEIRFDNIQKQLRSLVRVSGLDKLMTH
ncbi:MAG: STAS domain-containing protein [Gammaproteobacteria bacterium]|nr:STAS domain-containing protein [Gammaproteobacteria bacterium]